MVTSVLLTFVKTDIVDLRGTNPYLLSCNTYPVYLYISESSIDSLNSIPQELT